jgi:hypothetical protein
MFALVSEAGKTGRKHHPADKTVRGKFRVRILIYIQHKKSETTHRFIFVYAIKGRCLAGGA